MDPFDKKDYRLVSTLPLLSKVYERVIYEQASNYFEPLFDKILCGYRKAPSSLYSCGMNLDNIFTNLIHIL